MAGQGRAGQDRTGQDKKRLDKGQEDEMIEQRYSIKGMCPLLTHNVRLANPLDPIAKAIHVISTKRNKTDADREEMARLEHMGGLYLDEKQRPVIPSTCWEGGIFAAAKKFKLGKIVKAAVLVSGDMLIGADGPTSVEGRWADPACWDYRAVGVQGGSKIMRTRPIFRNWSGKIELLINESLVNEAKVFDILVALGSEYGICDSRPHYGRFEVERC